jgi:hypothetical protein
MDSLNRTSNRPRERTLVMAAAIVFAGVAVAGVLLNKSYTIVASGAFHPVSLRGTGRVRIVAQRSGLRLELIDIRLGDESQAEVRIIAASDALDNSTAETTAFRGIGTLPAKTRSAAYPIDPSVDLGRFRAVVLWSSAKHLNLITAPLVAAESAHSGAR